MSFEGFDLFIALAIGGAHASGTAAQVPHGAAATAAHVRTVPAAASTDPGYRSGLSIGVVREGDPGSARDLAGMRLGFFAISRGERRAFAGSWYLEFKDSRDQEAIEAGVTLAYPYYERSMVGFGPRFRAAIQERAEPPHRGTDGSLGLGFEVGAWAGERVHVAAVAERLFGFETGVRTAVSLDVRIRLWAE